MKQQAVTPTDLSDSKYLTVRMQDYDSEDR
jgi:hypothetical protein